MVLFDSDKMKYFFPMSQMSHVEKINALTRFLILVSIVTYLIKGERAIFLVPILFGVCIYLLALWKPFENVIESFGNEEECRAPSLHNPFMNTLPSDKHKKACFDDESRAEMERSFKLNLFSDRNDVYGRRNSQRQFYTVPTMDVGTTFATWLYATEPTCKEKNIACYK